MAVAGSGTNQATFDFMAEQPPPVESVSLARSLVDAFASGWARADVDQIMSVFAPNAVFQEAPFAEPVTGWDAIRGYWADVPYRQSEITVSTGEIYVAGPWFATEFKAVFRRRRSGEWVEARGAIFCETDQALITEMRMYWHRST
jgi:hypothetical protein